MYTFGIYRTIIRSKWFCPVSLLTETYKSSHPIHLHGHYFQVLDIQFGNYTPQGVLNWPNEDIHCGGAKEVCTVPSWSL